MTDLFGFDEATAPETETDAALEDVRADVSDPDQAALFDLDELDWWRPYWTDDLPEYVSEDATAHSSINVQFRDEAARAEFLEKMGEKATRVKSIWYPSREYLEQSDRAAEARHVPAGRYPIYVISKGRWDSRLTVRALDKLGLPYLLVIEPTELESYAEHVSLERILTLPFHDLGQGSIPARNWVWEHAVEAGAARHWILDDNLDGFYRLKAVTQ